MKRWVWITGMAAGLAGFWLIAQPSGEPLMQGYRDTEVASVSDAMEQLYGQQTFMSHEMRPLEKTKFAGPAWTVKVRLVAPGTFVPSNCHWYAEKRDD